MRLVWTATRALLRRRRGTTVTLVLLVGLAGGVVLAAAGGASRTNTAMRRFAAYSRPEDAYVVVNGAQGDPRDPAVLAKVMDVRARVLALPQVADAGRAPYLFLSPDRSGAAVGSVNPFAAADARVHRTFDRAVLLRGRFADLDRAEEAVVDDVTAARRHIRVGDRTTMYAFSAEQMQSAATGGFGKIPAPAGAAYDFRVVGIVRDPTTVNVAPPSVASDAIYQSPGAMTLTPAFLRRFAADMGVPVEAVPGMEGYRIRFRHGLADGPAFAQAVKGIVSPGDGETHLGGSDIQNAADKAQRPIHLEAIGLVVFAGLAALAALLIVGQAVARQVAADAGDNPTLAALGVTPRQLVLVPMMRSGVIAVGGAGIAVVVALALSPLAPIGLARRAEIHPGVSANLAVLAIGFVAVVAAVGLRALVSAWRVARVRPDEAARPAHARSRPPRSAAAATGLGPAATAAAGMAFERGRGLAFRTALVGTLVAVAGVAAAMTFGASLRHLVDTPREQGWNWDVIVGNPNSQGLGGDPAADTLHNDMVRRLSANRYVGSFSGFASVDSITIDGHATNIVGIERTLGGVFSSIVEGRTPQADDEIALGRDVLDKIHKRVGQTVTAQAVSEHRVMRIVGVALQPTASDVAPRLSRGGAVTLAALHGLGLQPGVFQFAVRYKPGVDQRAAFTSLLDDFGREVLKPYPGGEVGDLARVDLLPYVLAGLLVVLAVGTLALTLIGSVRRHHRDLAVLKTIGFVRAQVSATLAWQATALAVAALVVGVPCGIAIGRWTWHLVASGVGSVSPATVPLVSILFVVPATLLLANLLAVGPGWAVGRARPAAVLRAE